MNLRSTFVFLFLNLVQQICAQCDDGNVRLTGGPNKFEGRVEICEDGSWGQVCAMGWTGDDAKVVCRQLGHSTDNPLAVLNDVYGGEAVPARVNNVRCTGNENELVDCPLTMLTGSISCTPAGVVCQDPECMSDPTSVRLSEEQVVEVCAGGYRTGVCSSNWDDTDASVVCRQLSLGDNGVASSTASVFYSIGGVYDRVNCTNSDQTLSDCEHDLIGGTDPRSQCSTGQFAQVECKAFAATTTPPAETTTQQPPDSTTARTNTEQTTNSTATNFEDITTDGEPQNPTSESATTDPVMEPGSPQSQSDSQLLAIVLGAVGGLIVVLLFGIIVLLAVVILGRQRRKYSMQYIDDSANGQPVMAGIQITGKEDQLVNSYSSQKSGGGDPDHERHLLNPLYLQKQQQMANNNPLPYASVVTPPSTADDSQLHEYATLDNFEPTVSQWPPTQPQEYSNPVVAISSAQNNRTSGAPNVYSEPVLPGEKYKVEEDGIVTDLQGYASLDPTAHPYDYALTSEETKGGSKGVSTLSIPQPYETPFESSYEDASSTNVSQSATPAGSRRESPERKDTDSATKSTSTTAEENINPYAEPSPVPQDKMANSDEAPPTHDYATLEPPK